MLVLLTVIGKNDTIFIIYITRIILKGSVDMKKKLTSVLLAAILTLGITACSSSGGGSSQSGDSGSTAESSSAPVIMVKTVDEIKAEMKEEAEANDGKIELALWTSGDDIVFYNERIEEFKQLYSDPSYELKIQTKENAPDTAGQLMLENYKKGGDVVTVRADCLAELSDKGFITAADSSYYGDISEVFTEDAVQKVTVNGTQYAYPLCYNTLFLIYDKRVYTDPADLTSLDSLIAKAEEKNMSLGCAVDLDNLYYSTPFFLAAGMDIRYENGVQTADFSTKEGLDGFNSIKHYIEMAGKGFYPYSYTSEPSVAMNFASGNGAIAGFIGGGWNTTPIRNSEYFDNENLGIAKLPTVLIDGEQKQLEPLCTVNCFAVNSFTKYPKSAQAFAAFISKAENMKLYSEQQQSAVPLKEPDNEELAAIKEQAAFSHSFETTVSSDYWACGASDVIKSMLEQMRLEKKITMTNEELKEEIRTKVKVLPEQSSAQQT